MATVTIAPDNNTIAKQYAQEKGCNVDEAVDRLIQIAAGRLAAIRKDAKRRAAGKPTTHRKVTVVSLEKKAKAAPQRAKAPKVKKAAKAEKVEATA